jgi:hypothetical protein
MRHSSLRLITGVAVVLGVERSVFRQLNVNGGGSKSRRGLGQVHYSSHG